MEQAQLNTKLYQKMYAEQDRYKAGLLKKAPEEILSHAYEYVTREDILLSLEYNDLLSKQARALLRSDTPLADVFTKWESWETNYMEHIWDAVVARANDVVRADFIAAQKEAR